MNVPTASTSTLVIWLAPQLHDNVLKPSNIYIYGIVLVVTI